MRSVSAAVRAAERESQRQHKQFLKEQIIEEASDAVEDWQNYIHELISIHTNIADDIDWQSMHKKPEPKEPKRSSLLEVTAQKKLDQFKPRAWDFLRGGSTKKRELQENDVVQAKKQDDSNFREAMQKYETARQEWLADTELATRLLAGDIHARKEVIQELQSLSSEGLVGSRIEFEIKECYVHAICNVHNDEVVPIYRRKQLQSGKLSETKMPKGELNELYQDYVCSVALRIAGDVFGILPVAEVYVTCVTPMLNSATGHLEDTSVLSVFFVRETFKNLNLDQIDPSDSLKNFNHAMNFKRTKGFSPIIPLPNGDNA